MPVVLCQGDPETGSCSAGSVAVLGLWCRPWKFWQVSAPAVYLLSLDLKASYVDALRFLTVYLRGHTCSLLLLVPPHGHCPGSLSAHGFTPNLLQLSLYVLPPLQMGSLLRAEFILLSPNVSCMWQVFNKYLLNVSKTALGQQVYDNSLYFLPLQVNSNHQIFCKSNLNCQNTAKCFLCIPQRDINQILF